MPDKEVELDLTICLITRGRPEFLDPLLNSLSEALKFEWVKVIIVLNGTSDVVSKKVKEWGLTNSRIIVESRDKNDPRQSIQWNSIKKYSPGWCNFISDDDVFNPKILNEISKMWNLHPESIAISTAVEVIDKNGVKTGEIKAPFYEGNSNKARNIGLAFNKPGFPWPSLFLDIRRLPEILPNSRYAFDWWVGIQLILRGQVLSTELPGVQYRVHAAQESSVSSNRRKYFEALVWFKNIISSKSFQSWLKTLNPEELRDFWVAFNDPGPIYADDKFRPYLINLLIESFESIDNQEWADIAKREFALLNGVLLRGSELIHLDEDVQKKVIAGNFVLIFNSKTCDLIRDLKGYFLGDIYSREFRVGCRHVVSNEKDLIVDCSKLASLEIDQRADLVVSMLTEHLERIGYFDFTLSPVEIGIVEKYRKLKAFLPEKLLSRVKKRLRRSLTS